MMTSSRVTAGSSGYVREGRLSTDHHQPDDAADARSIWMDAHIGVSFSHVRCFLLDHGVGASDLLTHGARGGESGGVRS